jgi:hypothetical protein
MPRLGVCPGRVLSVSGWCCFRDFVSYPYADMPDMGARYEHNLGDLTINESGIRDFMLRADARVDSKLEHDMSKLTEYHHLALGS